MESLSEQSIHLKSSLEIDIWRQENSALPVWTVLCCLKPNLDSSSQEIAQAKSNYGELLPGQVYVLDPVARRALAVLSRASISSLDNTKPGRRHVSFALGAALADLLKARAEIFARMPIVVEMDDLLASGDVQYSEEFIAAMRMRFVRNHLQKQIASEKQPITHIRVRVPEARLAAVEEALQQSKMIADAMLWTKSLVNAPSNLLRPGSYERLVALLIKRLSEEVSSGGAQVGVECFKGTDLTEMGCHLIAAVGRGSTSEPRLMKLTYRSSPSAGAQVDRKRVALVGKGITFDSGGYNLKPSASMRNMKKDMGGSAVVVGAFVGAVRMGLPLDIDCYLALAENMVSGNSFRPGDVLTARDGSLIEIDNTDAEGRLVLSDALHLAAETRPDWILDFATLTGAARVALGGEVDALFSNESDKALLVAASGIETGDWVWHLPRVSTYAKLLESSVADTLNCSPSGLGGAVIAANFLERFVGAIPWTHVDTYMWSDKSNSLTSPESGATAKCVRLVIESLKRFCSMK